LEISSAQDALATWRERAEAARTMAETLNDLGARRMIFEIAERYEKLAWRLENEV
jgi:hypothetical protein